MSVAPPPPRKRKGEPPAVTDTLHTLPGADSSTRDTPLNFRVTRAFRKRFKTAAVEREITMVELLERLFEKIDEI
jgi:hypothetical protein